MAKLTRQRILRNYRMMGPGRFHGLNQRVRKSLADTEKFPESMWAVNRALMPSYFATSDKHDAVYHEAMQGSRPVIAGREVLQAQIVDFLDEIAAILEMAAVYNPELLLVSGFDLAKERRSHTRAKTPYPNIGRTDAEQQGDTNGN